MLTRYIELGLPVFDLLLSSFELLGLLVERPFALVYLRLSVIGLFYRVAQLF